MEHSNTLIQNGNRFYKTNCGLSFVCPCAKKIALQQHGLCTIPEIRVIYLRFCKTPSLKQTLTVLSAETICKIVLQA